MNLGSGLSRLPINVNRASNFTTVNLYPIQISNFFFLADFGFGLLFRFGFNFGVGAFSRFRFGITISWSLIYSSLSSSES